jgi:hypothetical protein
VAAQLVAAANSKAAAKYLKPRPAGPMISPFPYDFRIRIPGRAIKAMTNAAATRATQAQVALPEHRGQSGI